MLEIKHDDARAVINQVGAGLRAFDVAGEPYVETYSGDTPPLGAGAVLVPWPNRVAGAVWQQNGNVHELVATEPARGNAIHGLVRRSEWTVTAHEANEITLSIDVDGAPGWPFPFSTTISYKLNAGGLTITHGMHNRGESDLPFGIGTHPYPRPGNADIEDCKLTLAASTVLPLDKDTMVPSGPPVDVAGTEFDFRTGRGMRGVDLDTPFGGCEPSPDGLIRHSLGNVLVWAEPCFRWVQVFTPAEFPGKGTRAVAIEPMTCPPDALNSGTDLLWLKPGDSWTGRWGISRLAG